MSYPYGGGYLKMIARKELIMEEEIIVLSVGLPYDIAPEDGGPHVTGCTMWYIPTGDINKKNIDSDTQALGYVPAKERMGTSFYETAKKVGLPSVAKVTYGMKNSGGKMVLTVKGVDFIKK